MIPGYEESGSKNNWDDENERSLDGAGDGKNSRGWAWFRRLFLGGISLKTLPLGNLLSSFYKFGIYN